MNNPFEYHKPTDEEITRIEAVRFAFFECLERLAAATHPGSVSGRYVALAKTALEESCQWAAKSIVCERDNNPDRAEGA